MFKTLRDRLMPRTEQVRFKWVIQQLTDIPSGMRLLDAGAGEQPYRKHCKHLQYSAQDLAEYTGEDDGMGIADGSWNYGPLDYTCDIWDIPEQDASFDVILCTEVMEHIPYPADALHEFSRLLTMGGTAMITTPINCVPHQTPYFFYHGLSRQFYEHVGAAAGLELEYFETYSGAPDYLTMELWRMFRDMKNWRAIFWFFPAALAIAIRALVGSKGPQYPTYGCFVKLRKVGQGTTLKTGSKKGA